MYEVYSCVERLYFCSILVFFLLFLITGINCNTVLSHNTVCVISFPPYERQQVFNVGQYFASYTYRHLSLYGFLAGLWRRDAIKVLYGYIRKQSFLKILYCKQVNLPLSQSWYQMQNMIFVFV